MSGQPDPRIGSGRSPLPRFPRVGLIGVGTMGAAMAARLLEREFPLAVRDIAEQRQQALVRLGARAHPSPASLAGESDIVILALVDAGQIDTILDGPDGLLGVLRPAQIVLVCSTIAPDDTERFASRIGTTGAVLIDAPISGGPARARAGTLSMMLAGEPTVLAALEPLLAALSGRRFLISARAGDAARAKLVNNLAAGIHLAAAAEALALARRLGLDMAQIAQLMSASSGQSWIADDRMPRALAGDFEPRARTEVLAKDLRLANQVAGKSGVDLSLGQVAARMFEAACEAGYADTDDAALLSHQLDLWSQT